MIRRTTRESCGFWWIGEERKTGDAGCKHPYVEYEADPLWPLLEQGIGDLVRNQDLVEQEDRNYIVGYLCKAITKGTKSAKERLSREARQAAKK